jgi:hypothetical protein
MGIRAPGAHPRSAPVILPDDVKVILECTALACSDDNRCRQLPDYLALSEQTRTAANDELVPLAGLEPARCCHHLILSQARLPIPPQGQAGGIIAAKRGGSTGPACRACPGQASAFLLQ